MKYLTIFVSALLFLCGLCGLVLSIVKVFEAIIILTDPHGHPGFYLVEALDTILLSIVAFILSGGIYKLFAGNESTFHNSIIFSKLSSFKELKVMLWEALLLTLTVWCVLGFYITSEGSVTYDKLITPLAILILALSLKFIKQK